MLKTTTPPGMPPQGPHTPPSQPTNFVPPAAPAPQPTAQTPGAYTPPAPPAYGQNQPPAPMSPPAPTPAPPFNPPAPAPEEPLQTHIDPGTGDLWHNYATKGWVNLGPQQQTPAAPAAAPTPMSPPAPAPAAPPAPETEQPVQVYTDPNSGDLWHNYATKGWVNLGPQQQTPAAPAPASGPPPYSPTPTTGGALVPQQPNAVVTLGGEQKANPIADYHNADGIVVEGFDDTRQSGFFVSLDGSEFLIKKLDNYRTKDLTVIISYAKKFFQFVDKTTNPPTYHDNDVKLDDRFKDCVKLEWYDWVGEKAERFEIKLSITSVIQFQDYLASLKNSGVKLNQCYTKMSVERVPGKDEKGQPTMYPRVKFEFGGYPNYEQ